MTGEGDADGERVELTPWYRGFKGGIVRVGDDKYMTVGCAVVENANTVRITELPVGYATIDFKNDLEEFADKCADVKSVQSHYTPRDVNFIVVFNSEASLKRHMELNEATGYPKLYTTLKLTSTRNFNTSNMYLFNDKLQIKKYNGPHEIIDNHYSVRLALYDKRREYLVQELLKQLAVLEPKLRFVSGIVNDEINIYKKEREEVEALLEDLEFPRIDESYDYLLRMQIYTLTKAKIEALEKEIADTRAQLEDVKGTSNVQMWLKELDEFEVAYEKYIAEWEQEIESEVAPEGSGGSKALAKPKKRAVTTRKAEK